MKNPLKHPVFWGAVGIYTVLLVLKKTGVYIPLISDYLSDLLVMPVVLSIALWAVRSTRTPKGEERQEYFFRWWHVAFTVGFYSLLFEVLFPQLTDRFTADPWDVLAYAVGGVLFFLVLNRKPPQTKTP